MKFPYYPLIASVLIGLFLTGCSVKHTPSSLNKTDPSALVELSTTPFFPEDIGQNGTSALAAILISSDIITLPELLTSALLPKDREILLPLEIIAAIRSFDRIPYRLRTDTEAITAELHAGRPVLILQDHGIPHWPSYTYAVVIGMRKDGDFILRSGNTPRLVIDKLRFLQSWDRGGRWAIIALKPGELPADHDLNSYLDAVGRMEAIGKTELAERSYRAVLSQHPHNDPAVFGLASTLFSQGNYLSAAEFFSYLLRRNPDEAFAANNLAESLSALECHGLALELIDIFLCSGCSGPNQRKMLNQTRDGIEQRAEAATMEPQSCEQLTHLLEF